MRIKRFTPLERLFHVLLMLSFMIQAATGLGRMYIETDFGYGLASLFGGYVGCLAVHKFVGLFMVGLFVIHLLYVVIRIRWVRFREELAGPDSLLPRPHDLRQFVQHLGWMFGLSDHPRFERWGYWEKFDYWAVFWGMVIIGGTGLMLYDHVATSTVFHGWTLNIALWVHRIEAMLAIAHVFIIHFFIAHLRKRHFPMDMAMFAGSADLEDARDERAAWVERLEKEGRLEDSLVGAPTTGHRIVATLFGLTVVAFGVYLLVFAAMNAAYITL